MGGLMFGNKDQVETLNNIVEKLKRPKVEVRLSKNHEEFIKKYAENWEEYDKEGFNDEELVVIKEILDKVFFGYTTLYEKTNWQVYQYGGTVHRKQKELAKIKDDLQALGEKIVNGKDERRDNEKRD